MVNSDKTIFDYKISPFIQAGAVLAIILIFMLVSFIFGQTGLVDTDEGTPWLITSAMSLFFTIANSLLGLGTDDQNKYWWQSILSYLGVAIIGGSLAYLISGVSMDDVGSYRWLFVLFAIGHIFFLALIRTLRRLVAIAKKQDGRLRGED